MPFTFSHPAAVLPINYTKKGWYSLTGLIMGSIAPDFEYFIRMDDKKVYTHTWTGIFLYDIILALLLSFIFHLVVRNAFINNTPILLQKRLLTYTTFNWINFFKKKWLVVIFSIIIGSVSHLLWDGFTHQERLFVHWISFLREDISYAGKTIPVYSFLQLASSALGAMVVVYAVYQLPEYKEHNHNINIWAYWVKLFCIASLVFIIRLSFGLHNLKEILVSVIASFILSFIITPFISKERKFI